MGILHLCKALHVDCSVSLEFLSCSLLFASFSDSCSKGTSQRALFSLLLDQVALSSCLGFQKNMTSDCLVSSLHFFLGGAYIT